VQPLKMSVSTFGTTEANGSNIKSSMARNLPAMVPAICSHDGHFVIVGSGPSMPRMIESIREDKKNGIPICAVKGAHDYLYKNEITPDLFICVDPRDRTENITLAGDETVYMMASRCHPAMFDRLHDKKVVLWHSFGDEAETQYYKGQSCIGGGSTSGLRAITVGFVLGFRNFILYGMDSCLAEDRTTKRFTGEQSGQVIDVIVGDKTFYCNGAMAQQATEIQELMGAMPDIHIEIRGGGLLAAIWDERKKQGMPV